MKIAVAGATGRVGTPLTEILVSAGHDVVPISRTHGVDVVTGKGVDAALDGVDVLIDAATGPSSDQDEATAFFAAAAQNLQEAAERAGVQRVVVVSIIGTDRFETGYNAAKRVQEAAYLAGPLHVTIVRAAQFHEFVEQLIAWGTQGDTAYLPEMRTQIVAARSAAETLAEVATDPAAPDGAIVEVAGPREERLPAIASVLAEHRGIAVTVEGVDAPGPEGALWASGALLPGPGATLAGPTFEEWLAHA